MSKARRAIVLFLLLITLIVGGVAIYIGIQLQQSGDLTPGETFADDPGGCGCSISGCGNGCWQWGNCTPQCNSRSNFTVTLWQCPQSTGQVGDNSQINCACDDSNGGTRVTVVTDKSGQLTVPQGACGKSQLDIFTEQGIVTGACFDFGVSCGGGPTNVPTNPPTVVPTTPEPNRACCSPCNSNSDCVDYSTAGEDIACINGRCSNVICPNNNECGTICYCRGSVQCGEACGYGAPGLCGDGISSCRYLSAQCPSGPNTPANEITVCFPTARIATDPAFAAEWETPRCVPRDQGNSYIRNKLNGRTSFSRAEIAALCDWCGNGKLDAGEQCDLGAQNGVAGSGCSSTCQADSVTNTPTPTATLVTGALCNDPCNPQAGASACPQNHTCVGTGTTGTCKLTACVQEPTLCLPDQCTFRPDCGEPCDPANGDSACPNDHTCADPDSNSSFYCVLDSCIDNPGSCQSDYCTAQNPLQVDKTGAQSCGSTGQSSIVNYSITITNSEASVRTVTAVDTLDEDVEDSYVSNISNGGAVSGGVITWSGLSIPANGSLTLTYRITFPSTVFSNVMVNTVVVTEAGIERGRDTFTITPYCVPGTALFSDEVDKILVAMMLIVVGMLMYRLGLHYKLGNLLWNKAGDKLVDNVMNRERKLEDARKREFEKRIVEEFDDQDI